MTIFEVIRSESRRVERVARRIIRRVTLSRVDGDGFAQAQGFDSEIFDDVELIQQYGLASRPSGGDAIIVEPGGGAGAVCIATRLRGSAPTDLNSGDVCLYNTDGATVTLSGTTVNVAGDTDYQILGTTLKTALTAFCSTLSGSTDPAVVSAASALNTALANVLSAKAKVG